MARTDSPRTTASEAGPAAGAIAQAEADAIAAAAVQSAADAAAAEAAAIAAAETADTLYAQALLRGIGPGNQTIGAGATATVEFDDGGGDSGGNWDNATYQYTVPTTGYYRIQARLVVATGGAALTGQVWVDGAAQYYAQSSVTDSGATSNVVLLDVTTTFLVGQTIEIRCIDDGGAGFDLVAAGANGVGSMLAISRVIG